MRSDFSSASWTCGIASLDRALALNPNLAAAWFLSGLAESLFR